MLADKLEPESRRALLHDQPGRTKAQSFVGPYLGRHQIGLGAQDQPHFGRVGLEGATWQVGLIGSRAAEHSYMRASLHARSQVKRGKT